MIEGLVPAPPHAGEFTHADLLPVVAATVGSPVDVAIGARSAPAALAPDQFRAVIVLVVDGLGWHQLLGTDVAPFLRRLAEASSGPIRAVVPSTTATNLVSIGTGRTSGDHGILGYTMVLDEAVFNTLVWRFGLRGGGADARASLVPETIVPEPTMLERLAAAGVATSVVLDPAFLDSGLTRAGLRGGQRLAATGFASTLERAIDATAVPGPAVVYAHHPEVDTAGHAHGPFTAPWREAVATVDRALAAARTRLPPDVALVVTADHGMVSVPEQDVVELDDGHPLLDGVRLVAGEPRLRTLVVDPDVDPSDVVGRFADRLGDRATVTTTADAIGRGWFGPDVPVAHGERLGDVLVASHAGSVPHRRVDPEHGRLPGLHGSVTAAERDVPLLVITAD